MCMNSPFISPYQKRCNIRIYRSSGFILIRGLGLAIKRFIGVRGGGGGNFQTRISRANFEQKMNVTC